ncbi:Zinc-metallopeptidase, peroxisomal, partial [Tetrabaena socialis]
MPGLDATPAPVPATADADACGPPAAAPASADADAPAEATAVAPERATAAAASDAAPLPLPKPPTDDLIKPANDDHTYRHLVLPNRLRVLLVSDPTTDKAGAAMDVAVGSLSDPDSFPGLAHFTEHMLFYSSEKYPVE